MAWHKAATVGELDEDEAMAFDVAGKELALFNLGGEYYATGNICTHEHAYLSDGYVEGDCIECPLHQGLFKIATGEAQGAPVTENIQTYPVKVEGDDILVDVPDK